MPIGDLLAQISGGASEPTPLSNVQRSVVLPKRKADDELRNDTLKTPRRSTPPSRPSQPSQPINRPIPAARPANGTTVRRDAPLSRPVDAAARISKPVSAPSRPSNSSSASKPTAAPARPPPAATSNAAASKVPPKKGSFAEILARGQRAQAVMGQVGKIQHKKVEKSDKGPAKKDAKEKREGKVAPSAGSAGSRPPGYAGSARPLPRPSANGQGQAITNRNGNGQASGAAKLSAKADEEPKKVRKAAAANTGYAGTSRLKPGAPSSSKNGNIPRGGALLNSAPARPSHSKRSRYDADDEDMDDFIDYDDEEEQEPRYGYASDESSDMEAGLDELDYEERKAERIAREEDIKEDLLEKRLKAAKEERKRQALEAVRSGRRH